MITYEAQNFVVAQQSDDYGACSQFITSTIEAIIEKAIVQEQNKIIINTNLKLGLPMENINKIAGPLVEAWAVQTFYDALEDKDNQYRILSSLSMPFTLRINVFLFK